jgi:hypothetical protein
MLMQSFQSRSIVTLKKKILGHVYRLLAVGTVYMLLPYITGAVSQSEIAVVGAFVVVVYVLFDVLVYLLKLSKKGD